MRVCGLGFGDESCLSSSMVCVLVFRKSQSRICSRKERAMSCRQAPRETGNTEYRREYLGRRKSCAREERAVRQLRFIQFRAKSLYTKVHSVIYDSGSVPRGAIFSPHETSPDPTSLTANPP